MEACYTETRHSDSRQPASSSDDRATLPKSGLLMAGQVLRSSQLPLLADTAALNLHYVTYLCQHDPCLSHVQRCSHCSCKATCVWKTLQSVTCPAYSVILWLNTPNCQSDLPLCLLDGVENRIHMTSSPCLTSFAVLEGEGDGYSAGLRSEAYDSPCSGTAWYTNPMCPWHMPVARCSCPRGEACGSRALGVMPVCRRPV